ncbi:FAD-binding domain-containing protein [Mycena metata]|uniref:FAD-binding domain-containing protein n=1 Tax=Mycena metata TaxID=1033252 RepID=A0AAD7I8X9_9AGAR|nr:FAD-binding domain-containing protein [Mycena metata]
MHYALCILIGTTTLGAAAAAGIQPTIHPASVCQSLVREISSESQVFYSGSPNYVTAMSHFDIASSQQAACAVEAGTPLDVGVTLRTVGASGVPFAVKGGGHATNPGFSSTTGVHISLARFNTTTYDASYPNTASGAVTIGAGLTWGQVYTVLDPLGVIVVGGRDHSVGVAGFILGGGYGYHSNQYGLSADTVLSFELVLPNGIVKNITEKSDADLFWALKGGGNNFGIVTSFVVRAFPQGQVWGGSVVQTPGQQQAVGAALHQFDNVSDPRAAAVGNFIVKNASTLLTSVTLFYDGPTPPPGIFDAFLALPTLHSTVKTRSFLDLVLGNAGLPTGYRGASGMVAYTANTPTFINATINEVTSLGVSLAANTSAAAVYYALEPFQKGYMKNSTGAYPPPAARVGSPMPMAVAFEWSDAKDDAYLRQELTESVARLQAVAVSDQVAAGQSSGALPRYSNYALAPTALEEFYGAEGLARLVKIAQRVDPLRVMALAGGWKLQTRR